MSAIFHFILKLPYTFCLYLLKIVTKIAVGADVWARHSYLDSTFVPLKSDLDISIFTKNNTQRIGFVKLYKLFKFCFPFLGEVNSYTLESVNYLKIYPLNIYELNRDPVLIHRFLPEILNNAYSKNEALVFLQRTFMNDYENLRLNKKSRILKWKTHFNSINESLKNNNQNNILLVLKENEVVNSITTALVNLAGYATKEEALLERNKLLLLIELVSNQQNYPWCNSMATEFNSLFVYFPWYVCYYPFTLPDLNPKLIPVLLAEIDWCMLVNLRMSIEPENVKSALVETEIFIEFLCIHLQPKYASVQLDEALKKLLEVKNVFIKMAKG